MRLLAIDTALAACSAAVLDTEQGGLIASESLPMVRGHAEALIPLLARLMREAHMAFGDLHRLAVTTGPGSFTDPHHEFLIRGNSDREDRAGSTQRF